MINDLWPVISHVRFLNVSVQWDYHFYMVCEFMVPRSEEIISFCCSQEESSCVWLSHYVFQNKFEFYFLFEKYLGFQTNSNLFWNT